MFHCCGGGDDHADHSHPEEHPRHAPTLGTHVALRIEEGKRVVAGEAIPAGTALEVAATLALTAQEYQQISPSRLRDSCHDYITERGEKFWLIALGLTSLCRQSASPSTHYHFTETTSGMVCTLHAARAIASGEEITISKS